MCKSIAPLGGSALLVYRKMWLSRLLSLMSLTPEAKMGTEDASIFNSSSSLYPISGAYCFLSHALMWRKNLRVGSTTSSFLPSMVLPSSSMPPTSSPFQAFNTTPSTHYKSKGAIIGESVGPALGGILFVSAGIALVFWRQKRRRERIKSNEWVWGDLQMERLTIK